MASHEENETEKNLKLAAEIGKKLLDENEVLTRQFEKSSQEYCVKIEALEQEKFSLQVKLDTKIQMESNYSDDIEGYKQALQQEKEKHELFMMTEYVQEIQEFKKQIEQLRSDADMSQLKDQQLKEEINEQALTIKELKEQLETNVTRLNETCSEELSQLHSDVNFLQSEKISLTEEVNSLKRDIQQFQLQVETLGATVTRKEEEIEDVKCHATSYFNALERQRELVQELQTELDIMKMDQNCSKKKGNSLFAELEDKRIAAEKKLITLKAQHEELTKKYDFCSKQMHSYKVQLSGILKMSGGHADAHYIEGLKKQLLQAQGEIDTLNSLVTKMERRNKHVEGELIHVKVQHTASENSESASDFLKAMLQMKDKELEKLNAELKSTSFLKRAENSRCIEMEQKLFEAEKELEKLKGANIKLHLKVEDLQLKYEPDKIKVEEKGQIIREIIQIKKPLEVKQTPQSSSSDLTFKKFTVTPTDEALKQKLKRMKDQSVALPGQKDNPTEKTKKVSISDDVDVHEISVNESQNMEPPTSATSKSKAGVKGGKRQVKVVKMSAASSDVSECKSQ